MTTPADFEIPALQLRRGTDTAIMAYQAAEGEPIYNVNTKEIRIGDGVTPGGTSVLGSSGTYIVNSITATSGVFTNISVSQTATINDIKLTGIANSTASNILYYDSATDTVSYGANTSGGGSTSTFDNITVNQTATIKDINITSNWIAIGKNASAPKSGTYIGHIAIGYDASASGAQGAPIAIGYQTVASGNNSTAIGVGATSSGENSLAFGQVANASNTYAQALGRNSSASAAYSLAVGAATASGQYSAAVGFQADSSGPASVAVGKSAVATKDYATAVGCLAYATGTYATAIGVAAIANGEDSVAIGHLAGVNTSSGYVNAANSIIINATGANLTATNSGLYIGPIRSTTSTQILYYNTTTKEITYGTNSGGGGGGGVTSITAGTGTFVSASTGDITIWTTSSGSSYDQTLNTNSNVIFNSVVTQDVVSAGGYPLDANGQALIVASNTQSVAMMVSNYTAGLLPEVNIRGYGQNRPGTVTTATAATPALFMQGARGTPASPLPTGSGDTLFLLGGGGYDGARWSNEHLHGAQIVSLSTEAFAGNATTATNAGSRIFMRTQPTGVQLNSTSRQAFFNQNYTAGSANAPPTLFLGFGTSFNDTPTLTMANGVNTHVGFGATDIAFTNTKPIFYGVVAEDAAVFTGEIASTTLTVTAVSSGILSVGQRVYATGVTSGTFITALGTATGGTGTYTVGTSQTVASMTMNSGADNTTLNDSTFLTMVAGRKSGVSGRRNSVKAGDIIAKINFFGQTSNNSTGVGGRGATIRAQTLENYSGTARGTKLFFATVNTGTTTEATRLSLTDKQNLYQSDEHAFYNSSNGQMLTIASYGTRINNGYLYIGDPGEDGQIRTSDVGDDFTIQTNDGLTGGKIFLGEGAGGSVVIYYKNQQVINASTGSVVLSPGGTTVASFSSGSIYLQSGQILAGDGVDAPRIQGRVGLRLSAANGSEGAEIDMNLTGGTTIISSGTNVALFNASSITFNDSTRSRLELSSSDHKVFSNNHVLHNGAGDGAYATFDNTQVVLQPGNTNAATFNTTTVTLTGSSAINLQSTQIQAGNGASAPRIQGQVGMYLSAAGTGVGSEVYLDTNGNTLIYSSGTNVALFRNSANEFYTPNNKFGNTTSTARVMSNGNQTLRLTTDTESSYIDITTGTNINLTASVVKINGELEGPTGNDFTILADGTNNINLNADTVRIGDNNADATLTTHGNGDLILDPHNGNVKVGTHLLPDANSTWDLGSTSTQWRSLYVSTATVYLGGNALSVAGGNLTLNGTTVGGGPGYASLTGSPTGGFTATGGFDVPDQTYTEITDSGGFAAPTTNGFTLDAGTYDLSLVVRGMNIRDSSGAVPGRLGMRLRNITDSTNVDVFDVASEWDGVFSGSDRRMSFASIVLRNVVTITGTKTFQFSVKDEATSNTIYFSQANGPALRVVAIKLA
jgi:hypothetical protein